MLLGTNVTAVGISTLPWIFTTSCGCMREESGDEKGNRSSEINRNHTPMFPVLVFLKPSTGAPPGG